MACILYLTYSKGPSASSVDERDRNYRSWRAANIKGELYTVYLDSEFEQVLGVGDRHRCLECCSPWARKESDTTDRLNWTDALFIKICFWPAWGDVFHKVPFCLNVRNEWLDLSNRSYYYLTISNGWTEIVAVASLSSSKLWSTS